MMEEGKRRMEGEWTMEEGKRRMELVKKFTSKCSSLSLGLFMLSGSQVSDCCGQDI